MADTFDVVIIGAGFAGLRAARDCSAAGLDIVLLEARDRIGGRTWTREYAATGDNVEFGGSYFTPDQELVANELRRYGIERRFHGLPRRFRWHTGGETRDGLPVPPDQLEELVRALGLILADVEVFGRGENDDVASLSLAAYLDRLHTTQAVRDFLFGWSVTSVGAPADEGAVSDSFGAIHDHGGLFGLVRMIHSSPQAGWQSLALAMVTAAACELRLDTPVTQIRRSGDRYVVTASDGGSVDARVVIVALPINCLPAIEFLPTLPAEVTAVFGGNAGAAVKVWMRATGIPEGCWGVGRGEGISQIIYDHSVGDVAWLVGFGARDDSIELGSRPQVERALHAFFPEADLLDWDWHDWNADPWALGTWMTTRPGDRDAIRQDRVPVAGTLLFATSDIGPHGAGWIEGALAAGKRAAEAAISELVAPGPTSRGSSGPALRD